MSQEKSSRRSQRKVPRRTQLGLFGGALAVFLAGSLCLSWAIGDARAARMSTQQTQEQAAETSAETGSADVGPEEAAQEATVSGTLITPESLEEDGGTSSAASAGGRPEAKPQEKKNAKGKAGKPKAKKRKAKKRRPRETEHELAKAKRETASPKARAGRESGTKTGTAERPFRKVPVYRTVQHKAVEITVRSGRETSVQRGPCPVCGETHAHDFTEKILVRYKLVAQ